MINTKQIRQRFAKANRHYAKHAIVQHQIAKQLIDYSQHYLATDLTKIQRVLEIGCGIGNLTQMAINHYPAIKHIYLNDLYDDIKNHHFNHYHGDIDYYIGDIQKIDSNQFHHHFHAILSSSALQWIYPLDNLLVKLYDMLDDTGYLIFSSFLDNNLYQIKALTGQGLVYYQLDTLLATLKKANFFIHFYQQMPYTLTFENPHSVLKHLQYTGVNATNKDFIWSKEKLLQFYHDYHKFAEKKAENYAYPLTYDAVYIIAQKQS